MPRSKTERRKSVRKAIAVTQVRSNFALVWSGGNGYEVGGFQINIFWRLNCLAEYLI